MNKAELIDAMASQAGLSKADAKRALDAFIDTTSMSLRPLSIIAANVHRPMRPIPLMAIFISCYL